MAYQIGSACVSCGACADVCPVGAISQGDDRYVIDANACLDCGTCSDTCPNGAINPADQLHQSEKNPRCRRTGDFFTSPGECRAWRWSPAQRIQGTR